MSNTVSSGFYLLVTGQIDGCQMRGYDHLYCKYSFNKGPDWSVLAGVEHGVSQISQRSSGSVSDVLTWNYPLDIMFRSTNVHGWPQVVIGVYGLTIFGGDVIRGYGCTHIPTVPGRYTKYVQLYTPVSSSLCQRFTAWITNNPPEFFDSKFIAQGKGREVTRVRSHGCVKITFNVTTKNMSEWGYQVSQERAGDLLTSQAQLNASLAAGVAASLDRPASASRLGQVPSKTQLSASTTAGLAAARSRAAAINPPSGANSRESSVVRRTSTLGQRGGGGTDPYDTSIDEEQKYPTPQPSQSQFASQPSIQPNPSASASSQFGQRPSPLLRPVSMAGGGGVELQSLQTGSSLSGGLAPIRQGSRTQF